MSNSTWNRTPPNYRRRTYPPTTQTYHPKRNTGPSRGQKHHEPYRVPPRYGTPSRNGPMKISPPKRGMEHHPIRNNDIKPTSSPPSHKDPHSSPPRTSSPPPRTHSSSPVKHPSPSSHISPSPNPTPPQINPRTRTPTPPKPPPDPWRIHYHIEKERLSAPAETKPTALLFYTDNPTIFHREGIHTSHRKITSTYSPHHLFGTAPERKVQLRDIKVTPLQIWNRETIPLKWDRINQDGEGYLEFEKVEFKIQLQRHHIPGTLFCAFELGDLSIFGGHGFPDVYFRIVNEDGEFKREGIYDLRKFVDIEEGELEGNVEGINGNLIPFRIGKEKFIRIVGEGMSRNWIGNDRGDLIIELSHDT
jgi:hypothetical protein